MDRVRRRDGRIGVTHGLHGDEAALERIYVKLGVETRTAAAGMAMGRIRQLHPEFEG